MSTAEAYALIVEDDASWQQILTEILTDAGFKVEVAADLSSALALLISHPHRLAVVDLSLAADDPHNQDGLLILEALGRSDPDCLKLLLTGFATVELAVSALTDYGAFTCLRKETFKRADFRSAITRALHEPHEEEMDKKETFPQPEKSLAVHEDASAAKALIVEDDSGWRSILSELLGDAGYKVRLCSSFGEALGAMRRTKFQLAVIDLSLSGDNPEAGSARELKGYHLLANTHANAIPTIVVSGMTNPRDIEQAYQEHGIFAYMEKQNFDRHAFLNMLQEVKRKDPDQNELNVLTSREREVLDLLAEGKTNKEIAETLFISTNTVKRHLKAVFEKLDIHTRSAAAAKAMGSPRS